jgi:hypothetical protein
MDVINVENVIMFLLFSNQINVHKCKYEISSI